MVVVRVNGIKCRALLDTGAGSPYASSVLLKRIKDVVLLTLDCFGFEDIPVECQENVYAEFQEQLMRSTERWYQPSLPWKAMHPSLPNNEVGSNDSQPYQPIRQESRANGEIR
jgi:hypothetical protein